MRHPAASCAGATGTPTAAPGAHARKRPPGPGLRALRGFRGEGARITSGLRDRPDRVGHAPPTSLQRHRIAALTAISAGVAMVLVLLSGRVASAAPETGTRLSVAEAQGPATRALTALHHNPAMLAGMPGTRVLMGATGGLDQRWIRRHDVGADGVPNDTLGGRESLLNPTVGYFAAASFYFEPFAIGFGVYDRGSQFNLQSSDNQRWHLAPEPDRLATLCRENDSDACTVNGGAASIRTDYTLAVAWNILASLRIGVGLHFPRMRSRFAYDNSRALGHTSTPGGADEAEGRCAESEQECGSQVDPAQR